MKNYKLEETDLHFCRRLLCSMLYQQQQQQPVKRVERIEADNGDEVIAANITHLDNLLIFVGIDVIVKNLKVYLFGRQM